MELDGSALFREGAAPPGSAAGGGAAGGHGCGDLVGEVAGMVEQVLATIFYCYYTTIPL